MKSMPSILTEAHYPKIGNGASQSNFNFYSTLLKNGFQELRRAQIRDVQVNVGKLCNQACNHCHVDAGPKRTEIMAWDTMQRIIEWCTVHSIETIDITGGAPELNPNFRRFVEAFVSNQSKVLSRCNLTVLLEPGQEDLAEWYAAHGITLICSLPCYTKENLESQRGKGVFEQSILALQRLNELGYGIDPDLPLDLVYNPAGAFLPPSQRDLEATYKLRLAEDFKIQFNSLYTITNLPISRFRHFLERNGEYDSYLNLLSENFNPDTVAGLMCRHIISVDWLGRIYDCDFNQMLNIHAGWKKPRYLWEIQADEIANEVIAVDSHCFGCTAGAGSSCTGVLT